MSLRTDRKLRIQGLEQRQLMAGDVAAYVQDGTLFIEGDDASNQVVVNDWHGGDSSTLLQIRGENGTRIDSQSTFFNPRGTSSQEAFENIVFRMGDGGDSVRFANTGGTQNFTGHITVDMGAGGGILGDQVEMHGWQVDAGINAYNADGVSVSESDIGVYLGINARSIDIDEVLVGMNDDDTNYGAFFYGANNIDVNLLSTSALAIGTQDLQNSQSEANFVDLTSVNVLGDANFYGDIAGDHITVDNMYTGGSFDIRTYRANAEYESARDVVELNNLWIEEDLKIDAGSNNRGDVFELTNSTINRDARLDGGNGGNRMDLDNVDVGRDLRMYGGSSRDTMTLNNVDIDDDLWMYTYAGDDNVTMTDVDAVDNLYADLGSGSDDLTILAGSSAYRLWLIGGTGKGETDSLTLSKRTSFSTNDVSGFEDITLK